ncbi:phosphatase PAP2 family protein [Bacteroides sp. CR5/BHMF/2]|nr:phosphatase PAP2 family protein [Bacteroides sp. CR5/BHMF/2]
MQQHHSSGSSTSASRQSGEPDCRSGIYRKWLPRGSYGFPSCHAANSLGLAMFVIFLFRKRWLSIFILTWAILNCYTRIYLGVHYPGDLLVGGIIGGFGGWLFCTIAHKAAIYLEPSTRTKRKEIKQWSVTIYVGLLTVLGIVLYSTIKSW